MPLWLYGGDGNNTLIGGAGNNVIVGGSGQNIIHSSNGVNTPQTVDDSDVAAAFPGLEDYFQDTGTWSDAASRGRGLQWRRAIARGKLGHGYSAIWTFANLDPTAYYDVYVTWSPIAGASMAAQYSVYDGGTLLGRQACPRSTRQQAPADIQAAGVFGMTWASSRQRRGR